LRKSYEAIKEEELRKNGKVRGYVVKSGKREEIKRKTVKSIVDNVGWGWRGCTLQVLHERTGYSKTTLKLYLDKLISVRAVEKVKDMYFLSDDFKVRLGFLPSPPLALVWDKWQTLAEYNVPKVLEPDKKGSPVKLVSRGRHLYGGSHKQTVRKKLREHEKGK